MLPPGCQRGCWQLKPLQSWELSEVLSGQLWLAQVRRDCSPSLVHGFWTLCSWPHFGWPGLARHPGHRAPLGPGSRSETALLRLCCKPSPLLLPRTGPGAAGQNKQHSITKNTAKLDRETEELHHDRVTLEVGKVIQQGRQSKGLTQKDLATVSAAGPPLPGRGRAGGRRGLRLPGDLRASVRSCPGNPEASGEATRVSCNVLSCCPLRPSACTLPRGGGARGVSPGCVLVPQHLLLELMCANTRSL